MSRFLTALISRALAALGLLAASLALAACGSSSPGQDAAARERASEANAEAKFVDYARCLREHGINAEVLTHPGGASGLKVSPGSAGQSPQAMEAAEKACARYRPPPQKGNPSPQQKVELEEAAQKFAKCLRQHGIEVEASAGGIEVKIGGSNPESPAFREAQEACSALMPGPKGGGAPRLGAGG
jgi:hypothetical protein